MKKLTWLVGLCGLGFVGWWFVGATATERLVRAWLDDRASVGWDVQYDSIETQGFPTEFRTDFTALGLADPATGLAWQAPGFTLTQSPVRPDRIRADWPREQRLLTHDDSTLILSEALWADLDVQPAANFALDRVAATLEGIVVQSVRDGETRLDSGYFSMVRVDGTTASYDIVFEMRDLAPSDLATGMLDPGGVLPPTMALARTEMRVTFDRPWDLSALERTRPQPVRIDLTETRAEWGPILFSASGTIDVDAAGRGTGDIAIRAENWRVMLDLAVGSGALPVGLAVTAERALGAVAGLSGRPDDIDASLRLEDGGVFFGPVPVGQAGLFRLR